jgi:riboflavin kinase / FMN adenylyltransferase
VPTRRVDGARSFGARPSSTLVAVGNFDGVHLGHRAVIEAVAKEARALELLALVLTFHPHPAEVLGRARVERLTTIERRVELITRLDPDLCVVVEPFTLELAAKTPEQFASELLAEQLGARIVIVGDNFRFGHKRAGDLGTLKELGKKLGFEARAHSLSGDARGPYSSSRVRDALSRADLAEVERLLGRPHSISGAVVHGDGRGRTIGVPTANLSGVEEALPAHGVYAVLVDELTHDGARVLGAGVANHGLRPTVGAGASTEVHLFDFDAELYGRRLRVHFLERLREERRFSDVGELVRQIGRDVAAGRELVAARTPDPRAGGAWY